jgi:hypothetical protein
MPVDELSPDKLRLEVPPDKVGCETSEELGPVQGIIGQERALKALSFAMGMKGKGFNVYVAGPPITSSSQRPSLFPPTGSTSTISRKPMSLEH